MVTSTSILFVRIKTMMGYGKTPGTDVSSSIIDQDQQKSRACYNTSVLQNMGEACLPAAARSISNRFVSCGQPASGCRI